MHWMLTIKVLHLTLHLMQQMCRSCHQKLKTCKFKCLLNKSSLADKARLLSVSAPHSTSWLSMVPNSSQCLHLDPDMCHKAIRWWLGINVSAGSRCCSDHSLDPLAHRVTTREGCFDNKSSPQINGAINLSTTTKECFMSRSPDCTL